MNQDELLPIVDENDIVIGSRTRKYVHENHLPHRGIHIFVVNFQGDILIQTRKTGRDYPGYYDSSVGAQVCFEETYEQAALRETKEELGFIPEKLIEICRYKSFSERQKEFRTLFVCYHEGPFIFDRNEIESIEFYSPDRIREAITKGEKFTEGSKISFSKYLEYSLKLK